MKACLIFFLALTLQAAETLTGAGATFPAPLYEKWVASFLLKSPDTPVAYRAVGSGAGIEALKKGQADFAASDAPLSDAELSAMPMPVRHIPTVVGGVVPAYHLEGLSHDLRFTPEILAGIYLGTIQQWNDPAIRAVNKGVALPARKISVIHRSDASGTTYIFTGYLAVTNPAWKSAVGSGSSVKWPVGEGAAGNDGVAGLIAKTPNSIGYVEFIYALRSRITYGSVRNAAGKFVAADLATLQAAAASASVKGNDFRVSLLNGAGAQSYPIAGFTYLIVPEKMVSPDKSKALDAFLRWILTSGQKQCSALGYAALPEEVSKRALGGLQ